VTEHVEITAAQCKISFGCIIQ